MTTLHDLAQECFRIKSQMEHDIRLFEDGKMTIHHNNQDVTCRTMERTRRRIDEMNRLWADLVKHAELA
jgi:hypothetical protein